MSGPSALADLPVLGDPIESTYVDEKKPVHHGDVDQVANKPESRSSYEKESSVEDLSYSEGALLVNGEPVIRNGEDVSNYLFDVRDDGDPPLTFRSVVLGTIFAGLGAAMDQVCSAFAYLKSYRLTPEVDLRLQAPSNCSVDCVPPLTDLLHWHCMGSLPAPSILGREHSFLSAGASVELDQPWRVPGEGGNCLPYPPKLYV